MSITHFEQSPDSRVSASLQIAIGHIEAAAWAMKSMTTYDDPADGITDADWLQQIAELLGELDPRTHTRARHARWVLGMEWGRNDDDALNKAFGAYVDCARVS